MVSVAASGVSPSFAETRPSGRRFKFFSLCTFGSLRSVSVPPAASTFSRAEAEIAWTRTVSFFVSSPLPRSLTSIFVFLSRPFSTSVYLPSVIFGIVILVLILRPAGLFARRGQGAAERV